MVKNEFRDTGKGINIKVKFSGENRFILNFYSHETFINMHAPGSLVWFL